MKTTRKIIAFLLVIAMTAVLFSGCGEDTGSGTGSKTGNGTGNQTGGMELPKLEITDSKMKYLCWSDPAQLKNTASWDYAINEKMKSAYNCEIEYVRTTYADLPVKAAQLVLSNDSPDLIFYKAQDDPIFVLNDIVQPVDEYMDFESALWKDVKDVNEAHKIKGKIYTPITHIINDAYTYYYTKNLEDLGLETPRSLYKKGEWTFSKMEEYAVKLTKKSTTGEVSVWGLAMDVAPFHLISGAGFVKTTDGKAENNLRDPRLATYMNYIAKLTYDLKVRPINENSGDLFLKGKAAMHVGAQWFGSQLQKPMKAGEMEFAPSPKFDTGETYAPSRMGTAWVAKGAKNPGGAMAYMAIGRLMQADPVTKVSLRERDTLLSGYDDEDFDLMEEMNNPAKFNLLLREDEGMGNQWGNQQQFDMTNQLGNWEKPWATCVEEYFPMLSAGITEINKKMDDFLKK